MPREDGVDELRDHRLFVPDHSREERLPCARASPAGSRASRRAPTVRRRAPRPIGSAEAPQGSMGVDPIYPSPCAFSFPKDTESPRSRSRAARKFLPGDSCIWVESREPTGTCQKISGRHWARTSTLSDAHVGWHSAWEPFGGWSSARPHGSRRDLATNRCGAWSLSGSVWRARMVGPHFGRSRP